MEAKGSLMWIEAVAVDPYDCFVYWCHFLRFLELRRSCLGCGAGGLPGKSLRSRSG